MGEESRCLADQPFFFCGSATLRQRALRPQLKREPLGSAMIECFAVQSSDDGARFELRRHNQGHLVAELHGRGLDASVLVSAYMFDGFADFFGGLATDWKGWKGAREWRALEGELKLKADSDRTGHVHLSVELRDGAPPRWQVNAALVLEAGQLDGLAARGREFEQSITSAA